MQKQLVLVVLLSQLLQKPTITQIPQKIIAGQANQTLQSVKKLVQSAVDIEDDLEKKI